MVASGASGRHGPGLAVFEALETFKQRIRVYEPPVSPADPPVDVRVGDLPAVSLPPGVARALTEALLAYHDPRDRGTCDHCGGARLDDNFLCADCGRPNGVFGQLLRERAARYEGPADSLSS